MKTTIVQTIIILILIPIFQLIISSYISSKIEKSISHKYDKVIEDYKYNLKIKEQASIIAEYVSIIVQNKIDPNNKFDYNKANQLAFQLALLLPDDLYLELKVALDPKSDINETNIYKVLLKVRNYLRNEDTKITDEDIIWHFPNK